MIYLLNWGVGFRVVVSAREEPVQGVAVASHILNPRCAVCSRWFERRGRFVIPIEVHLPIAPTNLTSIAWAGHVAVLIGTLAVGMLTCANTFAAILHTSKWVACQIADLHAPRHKWLFVTLVISMILIISRVRIWTWTYSCGVLLVRLLMEPLRRSWGNSLGVMTSADMIEGEL